MSSSQAVCDPPWRLLCKEGTTIRIYSVVKLPKACEFERKAWIFPFKIFGNFLATPNGMKVPTAIRGPGLAPGDSAAMCQMVD